MGRLVKRELGRFVFIFVTHLFPVFHFGTPEELENFMLFCNSQGI